MQQKDFIKKLHKYGNKTFNGQEKKFKQLKSLKTTTGLINFNCGFDVNGFCIPHKNSFYSNGMCCCKGCYYNIGYLWCIHKLDISTYVRYFRVKIGFWRRGKGCILPRELRSSTCVSYMCEANCNLLEKVELNSIGKKLRTVEKEIKENGSLL